jgi:ketopantoate reductase
MAAGTDTMRIAVIGAGAVGGSFGVALAKAGNDVTFVARGAHLAAMRARGLSVLGPRGDIHLPPQGESMVDSFVFQIDWTTVAMVIGLLASLIAVFIIKATSSPK